MTAQTFRVISAHATRAEPWHGEHIVEVRGDEGRFYAKARHFGCGKDAATPEAAIRSLLADNACAVVACAPSTDA